MNTFSHPDCTVGLGISPSLRFAVRSRALTAGRELRLRAAHPAPKVVMCNHSALRKSAADDADGNGFPRIFLR